MVIGIGLLKLSFNKKRTALEKNMLHHRLYKLIIQRRKGVYAAQLPITSAHKSCKEIQILTHLFAFINPLIIRDYSGV